MPVGKRHRAVECWCLARALWLFCRGVRAVDQMERWPLVEEYARFRRIVVSALSCCCGACGGRCRNPFFLAELIFFCRCLAEGGPGGGSAALGSGGSRGPERVCAMLGLWIRRGDQASRAQRLWAGCIHFICGIPRACRCERDEVFGALHPSSLREASFKDSQWRELLRSDWRSCAKLESRACASAGGGRILCLVGLADAVSAESGFEISFCLLLALACTVISTNQGSRALLFWSKRKSSWPR